MVTVGTDAKTALKIKGVKLLPSHDYAVVGESLVSAILSTNAYSWMFKPRYSGNKRRAMVVVDRFEGARD